MATGEKSYANDPSLRGSVLGVVRRGRLFGS